MPALTVKLPARSSDPARTCVPLPLITRLIAPEVPPPWIKPLNVVELPVELQWARSGLDRLVDLIRVDDHFPPGS